MNLFTVFSFDWNGFSRAASFPCMPPSSSIKMSPASRDSSGAASPDGRRGVSIRALAASMSGLNEESRVSGGTRRFGRCDASPEHLTS